MTSDFHNSESRKLKQWTEFFSSEKHWDLFKFFAWRQNPDDKKWMRAGWVARHHRRAGNEGREQRKCHKEIARPAESRSAAKKTCELIERQSKGKRVHKFVDILLVLPFCEEQRRSNVRSYQVKARHRKGWGGACSFVDCRSWIILLVKQKPNSC